MSYPESQVKALLERRSVPWGQVLRVAEVGSSAHGLSTDETQDDFDATVVRIEPFTELVTGPQDRQSMMIRTQPDGHRSRMGDIDLNVYTLRKFAGLAAKGNPSILAAIFSTRVHYGFGRFDFDQLARIVASKKAGGAFLGYMRQQIERWQGVRGQRNVNRPELVEKYGFDTKYAAAVIRLGYQGIEYMKTGRFTMPMPENDARDIVRLRTGYWGEKNALEWAKMTEDALKKAIDESKLPDYPGRVEPWIVDIYESQYSGNPDFWGSDG